jgi:tetratricopeptide (TPR) repeat protein
MSQDDHEAVDRAMWEAVEEAAELLHEENFHEALAALHEVLKSDPKNHYAYHFLGVGLYEVKELEGARDAFRACVKLAPKHIGASIALANVLRELGEPREAVQEGLRALGLNNEDGDALHAVGMAYAALGDRASAKRYLNAFMTKKPEFEVGVEVQGILDAFEQESAANRTN